MSNDIHFETPENIRVSYQAAGLGTRFVAWFTDIILIVITLIVMFIVGLVAGLSLDRFAEDILPTDYEDGFGRATIYFFGILYLMYSLGSLAYFGFSELLLRGQTIGKRSMNIRVVKADGFALDPVSIFVRSIFRVVDHLPPLWIVPLLTEKGQRLGDLVAGTVVVAEQRAELGGLREELASRRPAESQFHFDAVALKRARPQDVHAVEKILQRWAALSPEDRELLLGRLVRPLAERLQVECPAETDGLQFLEDFLAAEYRRRHRALG